MAKTQGEIDLEKIANYHDLDAIDLNEDKDVWPERNSALHAANLTATPKVGIRSERPSSPEVDGVFYRAIDENILYRYVSGQWQFWEEGLEEARDRYDDTKRGPLAAYESLGKESLQQLEHTRQIVGTRRMAGHWPMVDPHFRDDNFTYANAGVDERLQAVNYSFLEQPPNMVPVLRAQCLAKSTDANYDFAVWIEHATQPDGERLMAFTFGQGDGIQRLYDEIYLNEIGNGSAARGPDTLRDTQIEVHADRSANAATGEIYGASQIMLDWEVV